MDDLLFTLFWVFGWVLLLILIWHLKGRRRERRMEMIHKERMMAMEKGIPLPELPVFAEPAKSTLADAAGSIRINPRWPLGLGALFVMVGAGTSLALWLITEPDPHSMRSENRLRKAPTIASSRAAMACLFYTGFCRMADLGRKAWTFSGRVSR